MSRGAALALFLIGGPAWAQVFDISAPAEYLVAGQQAQFTAVAHGPDGQPLSINSFNWSSSDPGVLSVDSQGLVTATGLGLATIKATADSPLTGSTFGTLEMQVLPLRVTVTPVQTDLLAGQSIQFSAAAFDIRGQVIPNVAFVWEVSGENGFDTRVATIGGDGTLKAAAAGQVSVRAAVVYAVREGKLSRFEGFASANIKLAAEFGLTRLLAPEVQRDSFALRPSPGTFSINDAGQILFSGSLDALATGIFLYDSGRFNLLASGGLPAPFPGGVISGFQSAAINTTGQALIAIPAGPAREDGGLFLGSASGGTFLLLDGSTSGDQILDLSFFQITPNSLNDQGDIVFRALYHEPDTPYRDGLFRLSSGNLELIWSADKPLPGISSAINFILDNTTPAPGWSGPTGFGIDNSGAVYFMAQSGANSQQRAIFRQVPFSAPTKVIALGDSLLNSQVKVLTDLYVLKNGDLVLRVDLVNGQQHVARFSGGQLKDHLLVKSSPNFRVAGASANAALFTGAASGAAGKGDGLYRWQGTAVDAVLLIGASVAGADPIRYIETAAITNQGRIIAVVRTATNDFVVLQAGGGVLFQSGAPMPVPGILHLRSLVRGTRSTLPYFLLGDPSSIFELQAQGTFRSRAALGDRMPDATGYAGASTVLENSAGDLYFNTRDALYRLSASVSKLLADTSAAPDGVTLLNPKPWAVNDRGAVVLETNTTVAERRIYLLDTGRLTLLARTGMRSPFDGGTLADWTQFAIDEQNRVMAYFKMTGGGSGYFLYTNGKWQAAGVMNTFRLAGET